MFHSSHPHLCPKSTKLSPHKALCLLKFSEWVGSKSLVCIYNFSCHWLHKQMFICFWMTIRDRSNLFRVWELFFLRLRCWKLLLSQRFSLQRPKLQKEGTHTHPQTHTLAVAVYTQQKESAALLFFYFYAAPRPRLELPQRTGTSAPGRRALRVCQCVLAQRVGGLTKAGWAGAVISFSPRPCAELGSSWKNAPPSPGVSSASAPCKSPSLASFQRSGLCYLSRHWLAQTGSDRGWNGGIIAENFSPFAALLASACLYLG